MHATCGRLRQSRFLAEIINIGTIDCTFDINAAINMLDNTFYVRTYFTYIIF